LKNIFGFTILLFSVSAFAGNCPSLSGRWVCKTSDNSIEHNQINQAEIPNGMHYEIITADGSMSIEADGKPRTMTDDFSTTTITGLCKKGNSLLMSYHSLSNDKQFEVSQDLNATLVNANAIHQTGTAKITTSGKTQKIDINDSCTRE
jgi:hypothetical protein